MEVRVDIKDLDRVHLMLSGLTGSVNKVTVRALNKTLTGVKTDVSAEIRNDLNLSKKYVDKNIEIEKASTADPSGRVDVRSKPVGLINFTGTRQTKKGVSVKVKKQGSRTIIPHAFIAKVKGAENVWWRKEKPDSRAKYRPEFSYGRLPIPYRLPVVRLEGPRLTDNLSKPQVIRRVEEKAGERYVKNVDHELSRELERL